MTALLELGVDRNAVCVSSFVCPRHLFSLVSAEECLSTTTFLFVRSHTLFACISFNYEQFFPPGPLPQAMNVGNGGAVFTQHGSLRVLFRIHPTNHRIREFLLLMIICCRHLLPFGTLCPARLMTLVNVGYTPSHTQHFFAQSRRR